MDFLPARQLGRRLEPQHGGTQDDSDKSTLCSVEFLVGIRYPLQKILHVSVHGSNILFSWKNQTVRNSRPNLPGWAALCGRR